jgi:hypothetical protein
MFIVLIHRVIMICIYTTVCVVCTKALTFQNKLSLRSRSWFNLWRFKF